MQQGFTQSLTARGNFVLARLPNKQLLVSFLELLTLANGREKVTKSSPGSVAHVCKEKKPVNLESVLVHGNILDIFSIT